MFQADLAYQLIQIAQKFTDNPDFALYWTDLAYENFAVDPAGKVIVIDAEHIIVVDKEATKIGKYLRKLANAICRDFFNSKN